MSLVERNRKRKRAQQQAPSPMPSSSTPASAPTEQPLPASGDVNTPDALPVASTPDQPTAPAKESRVVSDAPNALAESRASLSEMATQPNLTIEQDKTPAWAKVGSYEDLVKINPNWSRGQYAYELSKYRREQGLPDLSYQEWANIIKDQNPYETEAERQKREKRHRNAVIFNGISSVLGNLANYVRTKEGHVAMKLNDGTEGYNRLERMRLGREQLARSNAKDYLGAIAQDRAERAKQAAAEAAAQQRERDYRMKEAELKIKLEGAKNERERKAAADALARLKFEHQQKMDAAKLKETQRHNKAQEAVSWHRAKNGGGGGTNKYLDLETGSGKKRYTPGEHGTNWVHKAYQDMLKEPDGKKFAVNKAGGMFGSSTPSEQEMYEAITKYNESQWKNRYKSNRYGGSGGEKPPLE